MKKTIAYLLMVVILFCTFPIAVLAGEGIVISFNQTDKTYSPGDAVTITATSPAKIDLVLRVIDSNGKIIQTDALLAPDNTGSHQFTFTLPNTVSAGSYNVVVGNETISSTATLFIVISSGSDGGGGGIVPTPPATKLGWGSSPGDLAGELGKVNNLGDAEQLISDITKNTGNVNTEDPDLMDTVATVTQWAMDKATTQTLSSVDNSITIVDKLIDQSAPQIDSAKTAMENVIKQQNFGLNRSLDKSLTIKTDFSSSGKATIVIDKNTIKALGKVDIIQVQSSDFGASIETSLLKQELEGQDNLTISFEPTDQIPKVAALSIINDPVLWKSIIAATQQTAYKVSFNKSKLKGNAHVSLPSPVKSDTQYVAVIKVDGGSNEVLGGKYNPSTGQVDVPLNSSGTYTVRENRVDFQDIAKKDVAMQEAIKVLASKGIIAGTGAGNFSPDTAISRAEIAKMVVKTLYVGSGGQSFSDIKAGDWYKSFAEAARSAGIINGYPNNIFAGKNTVLKEQLVAISARALRDKKKYTNPADVEKYLHYADRSAIPNWATTDISLASREGLVIKRTDSRFNGSAGITRGEAALMLKKLFDRI